MKNLEMKKSPLGYLSRVLKSTSIKFDVMEFIGVLMGFSKKGEMAGMGRRLWFRGVLERSTVRGPRTVDFQL
jgi:hypothetical protein